MQVLNSDWRNKSSREAHSERRQGCKGRKGRKGCKHAPAVLVCRLKSPRPTECECTWKPSQETGKVREGRDLSESEGSACRRSSTPHYL